MSFVQRHSPWHQGGAYGDCSWLKEGISGSDSRWKTDFHWEATGSLRQQIERLAYECEVTWAGCKTHPATCGCWGEVWCCTWLHVTNKKKTCSFSTWRHDARSHASCSRVGAIWVLRSCRGTLLQTPLLKTLSGWGWSWILWTPRSDTKASWWIT